MRILLISQYFDPETTPRGMTLAAGLVDRGHVVSVLTGFPNYPNGKIYSGYRQKLFHKEVIGGVSVYRVPMIVNHDTSALKRAANYLSFMVSSFLIGVARIPKFDIAYVYHPPITTGLSAALICFFRRKPFVCDIQDLWPDSVSATGMLSSSRLIYLLAMACNFVYKRAAHLVTISEGVRREIGTRGVNLEKMTVIPNWCDEDKVLNTDVMDPREKKMLDDVFSGRFNILFAGNMGEAQNLDSIIDAAIIAYDSNSLLQFVFIGGGTKAGELQERCRIEGLDYMKFLPSVPTSEIGTVLKMADVLLVHLRKDPLFDITVPSKTQAYMAIGKPILMAVAGDAEKIVVDNKCGIVAESDNPESVAAACLAFSLMNENELREMGNASRVAYEEKFSSRVGLVKFDCLFSRIVETQFLR